MSVEIKQSLHIRPAQQEDIGSIFKLNTLWSSDFPIPARVILYGLSKFTNMTLGSLGQQLRDPNNLVLVAESSQGIVGYLNGHILPDSATGWVQSFYVVPERRWGIVARKLAFAFEEFARSKGCLDLGATVLKDKRPHRLAKLMGWQDIQEISDDEVWISKSLSTF